MEYLRKKCTKIIIQKTLKKQSYGLYKKVIYTSHQYREYKRRKKFNKLLKKEKIYRKIKFLIKSRTYKKNKKSNRYVKNSSNRKYNCFICGKLDHLANRCPHKQNKNLEREY